MQCNRMYSMQSLKLLTHDQVPVHPIMHHSINCFFTCSFQVLHPHTSLLMATYSVSLSLTADVDKTDATGYLDSLGGSGTDADCVRESELLLNIFRSEACAAVLVNSRAPAAVSMSFSVVAETAFVPLWSKPPTEKKK